MKKLLLLILLAVSFGVTAQQTEKQIELPIKYYDALKTITSNKDFNFITIPETVIAVYIGDEIQRVKINNLKYQVIITPHFEIEIINADGKNKGKSYLSIINNTLVGYGFIDDTSLNRYIIRYYYDKKVVKDAVIKK